MTQPRVSVIILNWNGWEDTIECLESVYKVKYPNYDVIVVDNASKDDSIENIRKYCSGQLEPKSNFFEYNSHKKTITIFEYDDKYKEKTAVNEYGKDSKYEKINDSNKLILIKNNLNHGFPGGNNIGIRFALNFLNPDYILLLNNDTIVDKNFLDVLVGEGQLEHDVGILGPKIYFYDEPDVIWCAGCKISWKLSRGIQIGSGEIDQGQYDKKIVVEYVSGSAFLIKTEVICEIGLMDEKYFLYFEESDWTLRANQAGFKSLYVPDAKVWHKVSRSGGGISNPHGLYYITRNRWIFMRKWAKKSDYVLFVICQLIIVLIFPIMLSIYYRNQNLFSAYYYGFFDGIKS